MTPAKFPEANCVYKEPPDMAESQCGRVNAYVGRVAGGSIDGAQITVVAWEPTAEDIRHLIDTRRLYISFIGGMPPHYPSVSFQEATHPA